MISKLGTLSLSFLLGVALSAVFVIGFTAGTLFGTSRSAADSTSSDKNLKDFLTAYHLVTQRSYYRPFDRRHLVYAAIDGMLAATGDPHTLFFSPQDNQVANRELNGVQFSGIGAIVVPFHGQLQVVAPLPKTPATEAGLHAGDIVTRIDGLAVSAMSGSTAVARIHGRAGTVVRLTVVRSHGAPFVVPVRRAQIPPITAYGTLLSHGLGDIRIASYGDSTSGEVADALAFLVKHHVRGIVLDLRGNPGGYVDAAQRVVSQFVSDGAVAYERGAGKSLTPLSVVKQSFVTNLPVAVLVDGGTASAAEITAGALRDHKRALLFGTRTYGKGSMQSVYALADGSTIRLTDRLWLTPNKHSIQQIGLQPDVQIAPSNSIDASRDPTLRAAEKYLLTRTSR
ncbi:MAG: S41 family peptidase [Chloroflexota bacterium]